MPRAVVDHNVFVAGLLSSGGPSAELIDRLRDGQYRIVYTSELAAELRELLSRPRMRQRYGITRAEIRALLKLLQARGRRVSATGKRRWCRDPDDDILCEAALAGRAHYLVTNDQDLLAVALVEALRQRGVQVMRPQDFVELLRGLPVRLRRRRRL